jgi:hypothetical protein
MVIMLELIFILITVTVCGQDIIIYYFNLTVVGNFINGGIAGLEAG